jgi:hypothetical protein
MKGKDISVAERAQGEAIFLEFYRGKRQNLKGKTIDDIWAFDDADIDSHHDFIQWLFPTKTPSCFYTQNTSRVGIWATRKLSQFGDRKLPNINNMG